MERELRYFKYMYLLPKMHVNIMYCKYVKKKNLISENINMFLVVLILKKKSLTYP